MIVGDAAKHVAMTIAPPPASPPPRAAPGDGARCLPVPARAFTAGRAGAAVPAPAAHRDYPPLPRAARLPCRSTTTPSAQRGTTDERSGTGR
jgi:hypothetical protein